MRKMQSLLMVAVMMAAVLAFSANDASAGFKLKWDDDTYLDLGGRYQFHAYNTQANIDGDSTDLESVTSFKSRRARFRLGGQANKFIGFFLQTEAGQTAEGAGYEMRLIDAFMKLKFSRKLNIWAGETMVPVNRYNITSSGALMTMDRTASAYKTLNWGLRARTAFTDGNYKDGDVSGKIVPNAANAVRDIGATFWGVFDPSDTVHVKYYLGVYDGVQTGVSGAGRNDNFQYAARIQLNLGAAESGHYHQATYFGKKDTIAIGFGYNAQDAIMKGRADNEIDYKYYTLDLFIDKAGLTFAAAWSVLDLGEDAADTSLSKATGNGIFAEAGYMVTERIQPWVNIDTWDSEAANDLGSYTTWRIGATYLLDAEKGHRANVKLGYEQFTAQENFTGTDEDTINTIMLGLFSTF